MKSADTQHLFDYLQDWHWTKIGDSMDILNDFIKVDGDVPTLQKCKPITHQIDPLICFSSRMLMLMQFLCKKIQCTFLLLQLHSTEPPDFRLTPWQPLGTLRAVAAEWALPRRQIAGVDRTRHSSMVHTPGGYGERAAKWAASRHWTDGEVRLARLTSLTLLHLKATWWLEPARFISSTFHKLWKPMWVWAGRKILYAGKRSPQGQQVTKVPQFSLTTIQESPHRYQEQSSCDHLVIMYPVNLVRTQLWMFTG